MAYIKGGRLKDALHCISRFEISGRRCILQLPPSYSCLASLLSPARTFTCVDAASSPRATVASTSNMNCPVSTFRTAITNIRARGAASTNSMSCWQEATSTLLLEIPLLGSCFAMPMLDHFGTSTGICSTCTRRSVTVPGAIAESTPCSCSAVMRTINSMSAPRKHSVNTKQ